jgi:hypothetical protein
VKVRQLGRIDFEFRDADVLVRVLITVHVPPPFVVPDK